MQKKIFCQYVYFSNLMSIYTIKRSDFMSVNLSEIGVLEILLMCMLAYSITLICVNNVNNVKGRLLSYISLLSYVVIKSIFFYY